MSVRSWCIGIAVAGVLVVGLAFGFVRTQDSAPPSLGGTIEVTRSPEAGTPTGGKTGGTGSDAGGSSGSPGSSGESGAPSATPSPNTGTPDGPGGRAVSPPQVDPDDDDDDDSRFGDDDRDDG